MFFKKELTQKLSRQILLNKMRISESAITKARSVAGQPLSLYVETLSVTDESIYNKHKILSGSSNQNVIFEHMRIYYAHSFNGVNQRYANSFATDPDLKILIKLTNFLFLTVKFFLIY